MLQFKDVPGKIYLNRVIRNISRDCNTNPSKEDRAKYLSAAKKHYVPARCYFFTAPLALANHMNIVRARLGIVPRISSIAYNMFKSKLEDPTIKEGFVSVTNLDPVADFSGLPPLIKTYFFQLS